MDNKESNAAWLSGMLGHTNLIELSNLQPFIAHSDWDDAGVFLLPEFLVHDRQRVASFVKASK